MVHLIGLMKKKVMARKKKGSRNKEGGTSMNKYGSLLFFIQS